MRLRIALFPLLGILQVATLHAAPYELAVCTPLVGKSSPAYHGIATTRTQLRCEMPKNVQARVWTLPTLIEDGWQPIHSVGGNARVLQNKNAPRPIYYLERDSLAPEDERGAR